MSYKIVATSEFQRSSKKLLKKHKSLKEDLLELIGQLENNPTMGTPIGKDCYKIRLVIKSTGKGKSGGARVITCIKITTEYVYLLTIYSKSERDSISSKELTQLINKID